MKLLTNLRTTLAASSLLLFVPLSAHADRDPGWEFGVDVIYMAETDIDFEQGTTATLDDDYSLALKLGYRVNEHLEFQFALDYNEVDYRASIRADAPGSVFTSASGKIQSFTPRVDVNYNLLKGPLTPYVSANIGWAFIDTNIPNSLPQTYCWWDPWFGYVCSTYQSTVTSDEFVYGAGVGMRWDAGDSLSIRLSYNKQWMDLGKATSTPDMDQFRLGVAFRY